MALEYPAEEPRALDDFMYAKDGKPQRLLASAFWTRPTQDGRTSQALLAMLLWARGQAAGGERGAHHRL
jgi:hypothetical protein